jgi:hypothetical protein
MRWDAIFADLEGQADALAVAERAAEVETRTRGEIGRLALVDRLRAAIDAPLRLRISGGVAVSGRLLRAAPEWLLVDEGGGREVVVASAHLLTVRGLGRYSAVPGSGSVIDSRLGLASALRGIARDRTAVRLHLAAAAAGEGSSASALTLDATLDRVGADFVEVAAHGAGEVRRRDEVREIELVPLRAVAAVRRSG